MCTKIYALFQKLQSMLKVFVENLQGANADKGEPCLMLKNVMICIRSREVVNTLST